MTLYQINRKAAPRWSVLEEQVRRLVISNVLVPVEPEEAWLTLEDIGPSAVWIVNHEEQPDYMAADHVLIVKLGDNGE